MPTQLVQHGPPGGPMPSAVQFSDPWNFDTTLKQHDDKSVSGFSYQPSEKKEALKLKQLHSPKLTHIFTTPPQKKILYMLYIQEIRFEKDDLASFRGKFGQFSKANELSVSSSWGLPTSAAEVQEPVGHALQAIQPL